MNPLSSKISPKRKNALRAATLVTFFLLAANMVLAAAPDAVIDFTAGDGDGEVTLTWTVPANNGSAITGFTIEYDEEGDGFLSSVGTTPGASCTGASAGSTCTYILGSLTNFQNYEFRVTSTNGDGTSAASNEAVIMPTPCSPVSDNDDSGGPTVSKSCVQFNITAGTLTLENVPDNFNFPLRYSSSFDQNNFSNDNAATSTVDVTTGSDDILTVSDLRNSGSGFDVTITASDFQNVATDKIPLRNLYVATMYPTDADLTPLDANLIGTEVNEAEFAAGSSSTANMDTANSPFTNNGRGTATTGAELTTLINAYKVSGKSFDANQDNVADTITLMSSTAARVARVSQALGFYVTIPGDQPDGTYTVTFTIDLIEN